MGFYKRTKLPFDVLRYLNPIHKYPYHTKPHFLRKGHVLNHGFLNQNQANHLIQNGAKRFYYGDHFWYKHWLQLRNQFNQCLVTVPFAKRRHFVLLSKNIERKLGENHFNVIDWKILPAMHPQSVRVRVIAKGIIESLKKDTSGEGISEGKWSKADEILDDKWVQRIRNKGREIGHLEGFDWDVVVVDQPTVYACCFPGGKIVLFRGLLDYCRSDAELATVIAHEVAHVLARHRAEKITKLVIWMLAFHLFLETHVASIMPNVMIYIVFIVSTVFLMNYLSRRMEMEADYVGLMLIASAGYDPWVATKLRFKMDKHATRSVLESAWQNNFSTHPTYKKRAELLAQPKVMEEALLIYRGHTSKKGCEGC